MSKKVKVLISVMVAVLLVVTGATVVMAQEESEPTPEIGAKGLLVRVADILDISPEELIDAFRQVRQEMTQEALIGALGRAVENECIAQEESTQIMEWWQQRPEAMNQIRLRRFCAPSALGQRYMWRGHGGGYGPGMFEPPAD